jgi:hypothetical protein
MVDKRKLAYKDKFVLHLVQVLSDRFDSYPTLPDLPFTDLDTRISVTFDINNEEYTKMYSALSVGAELAFPNESHELMYIFEVLMSFCSQVIECINTDVEVQNSLTAFLNSAGFGSGAGTPNSPSTWIDNPEIFNSSLLDDCNPDIAFGVVTQLIDAIDSQLTSFFELLEAQSNGFERAAIIAEAIPGSDQAGFDTLAAGFDQVLEEVAENYAANFTPTLRDEYRCDLFCLLVNDDCEIDFQSFADYFLNRVGASINTSDTFGDAVGWFVSGTWSGSQVPDAAFGLVLTAMSYATAVVNMDINWLLRGIAASLNDPDPDWSVLCEDCASNLQIVPVIEAIACQPSSGVCGTVVGQQTTNPNVWRLSSTFRAVGSDNGISFRDTDNRLFTITDYDTVSGSSSVFSAYCNAAGTVINHGFGIPIDVPMRSILIVAAAPFTADVTFDEL